jgi:hypothetical protein
VKRLLTAACLLPLAVVAFVVAPAIGSQRWRPDPVDFELAPEQSMVSAASTGRVVSRPLRAPARFNLVGLRWRGRAEPSVAVRVRRDGHRWSRWQALDAHADHNPDPGSGERPVAASDPLWVGEADQVQYRLGRRVPALRLHFVNVAGTATARERATTALRNAASTVATSVIGALAGGDARAQGDRPPVVSRAAWGADRCRPRSKPSYGTVRAVHVHHTVSLNDYSPEEAPGIVLAICRYHRNSNGWNDIGYQALVDKYGVLYEGRAGGLDKPVLGAHAQGYNAQASGIASIGDNSAVGLSDTALGSLADYIRWKLTIHGQPLTGSTTLTSAGGATSRYPAGRRVRVRRVLGHRDTNSTACPGSALYYQLEDLRSRVATGEPLPGVATFLTASLSRRSTPYGGTATLSGALTDAALTPLAGRPVRVEVLRGARWRTLADLTTDSAGTWSTPVRPVRTRLLRATYAGDPVWRRSFSPEQLLRLKPLVKLAPGSTTGVRGKRVRLSGTVAPRKRRVYQVLQQRVRGAYRQVGVKTVRVRAGRFRSSFVPAFAARYRVYVLARADSATAAARSRLRKVVVTPTPASAIPSRARAR